MGPQYHDGWSRMDFHDRSEAFWLSWFKDDTDDATFRREGAKVSPIYEHDDGGIGVIQWFNATYNRAAVLFADGGWRTGGYFHLWVSTGVREKPYKVPVKYWPTYIEEGANDGWKSAIMAAAETAEQYLGLRRFEDSNGHG